MTTEEKQKLKKTVMMLKSSVTDNPSQQWYKELDNVLIVILRMLQNVGFDNALQELMSIIYSIYKQRGDIFYEIVLLRLCEDMKLLIEYKTTTDKNRKNSLRDLLKERSF